MAAALLPGLPLAAATPSEHNLAETIDRFESLRVDSSSAPVSDLRLASGHLTLVCKSGSVSLVRAGDEVVGVFFQGSGALEYQSVDPIEFPLMSFNVRKATSLSAQKGDRSLTLRDNFTQVLWLATGQPLPKLLPEARTGPALQAAFERQQEKFQRARGQPVSHFFALQKFDAPASPLVIVHVDGGAEDVEYSFDGGQDSSEGLLALRKSDSRDAEMKKFLFRTILSDQPIGRDRRDPLPPRFVLTDVDWEVAASEGREAKISVKG